MNISDKIEKSGDLESRVSARQYLQIFLRARKSGEPRRMTGRELRLYNEECDTRETNPRKADELKETRISERHAEERELREYFAELNRRMDEMRGR